MVRVSSSGSWPCRVGIWGKGKRKTRGPKGRHGRGMREGKGMQCRGQFVTQVTTVAPKGLTIKAALSW